MKLTRFRTQYDETIDLGIACTQLECMTKSEFQDDTDVNLLVARWKKTGILPQTRDQTASIFGDFSAVPSRAEMHDLVLNAHDAFDQLPADVRKEFNNDPRTFLSACEHPSGVALLKKHGLGKPEPTPSPDAPSAAVQAAASAPQTAPQPTKSDK